MQKEVVPMSAHPRIGGYRSARVVTAANLPHVPRGSAPGARPRTLGEAIDAAPLTLPGMHAQPGDMPEKTLEAHVRKILKSLQAVGLNLLSYHTHRSDRSEPGFPDWVFVGEWVMFRELKREKGRVRPEQKMWLDRITTLGEDAGIWRPADLASGRIARELTACAKGNR